MPRRQKVVSQCHPTQQYMSVACARIGPLQSFLATLVSPHVRRRSTSRPGQTVHSTFTSALDVPPRPFLQQHRFRRKASAFFALRAKLRRLRTA